MKSHNLPIRDAIAHLIPEPNAIYRPKGTPVRMALNRNVEELVDIRGIKGFLRDASGLPKGMILFTPDAYFPLDKDFTYRMYRKDFEIVYE